jgi:hypothetical protein
VSVRYVGSARGNDPGWHPPVAPKERRAMYWLVGLDVGVRQ